MAEEKPVQRKVTLDDMFRTVVAVNVLGRPYWMRALSDTDVQARDEYATRVMATRRKALVTPGSDMHTVYIEGLDGEDDEVLRSVILSAEVRERLREAQTEITPKVYDFPDKADDAEKADVLAKRDAEPARIHALRTEYVNKYSTARLEQLQKFDHTMLFKLAKERQVVAQTRVMYEKAFVNYTVYAAYFNDARCAERTFATVDQVGEMPSAVIDALVDQYFEELNRITLEDLQYFLSTSGSKDSSST
ncbi:hypothetical protein ANRL3_02491 [Anaerolineae bacterium]|nr:hypothetical protein ANRL3_02491 [Anaerolineae bacterium]